MNLLKPILNTVYKEEKNPWTTLSGREVYNNPWIKVDEFQVLNPNGNPGIYGVVHFKNIAVGVVPLDKDLNTYLVGQYRYTLNEYHWEIPEGGSPIDKESPLETAKRELLEETGLVAQQWQEISKLHTSNSVTDEVGYIYLAQNLEEGEAMPEDTEELKTWKLPLSEAVQMVMDNQITDALSVIALLKVQRMLEQGLVS